MKGYEESFLYDYSIMVDNTATAGSYRARDNSRPSLAHDNIAREEKRTNNTRGTSTSEAKEGQIINRYCEIDDLSSKDKSTQTDIQLSYPDLVHKILQELTSNNLDMTLNSTQQTYSRQRQEKNVSYVNLNSENSANINENLGNMNCPPLDPRVSTWIDDEEDEEEDEVFSRTSTGTVYEDIEDVIDYFETSTTSQSPPPPLPPRLFRSNSLQGGGVRSNRRKNLTEHLGIGCPVVGVTQANGDVGAIATAQRIAFDNVKNSNGGVSSRKDLNRFLGISESPVKLRQRHASSKRSERQQRNSLSFLDNFINIKLFKKGMSEEKNEVEKERIRRKRLDDYYDDAEDDDEEKSSRTSSFSSTHSSSSTFSTSSSLSMRSTASIGKLETFPSLPSSLRSSHGRAPRPSILPADYTRQRRYSVHDIVEETRGLPIIPFYPPNHTKHQSSSEDTKSKMEKVGDSLDAVISAAKLELSRQRSVESFAREKNRDSRRDNMSLRASMRDSLRRDKAKEESIYMDMSPNTSCELYMDMSAIIAV